MRRIVLLLAFAVAVPAHARAIVLCAVGDSLIDEALLLNGNPTFLSILQTRRRGADFAVVGSAVRASTTAEALTEFNSKLKGHGCTHLLVLTGTNPLASGVSAASIQTTLNALHTSAKEDTSGSATGINTTFLIPPPRGGSFPWDGTKEAQRLELRASMLTMIADVVVDLETMGCTGDPIEMCAGFVLASDKLHFSGCADGGNCGTVKVTDLVDAAVSW